MPDQLALRDKEALIPASLDDSGLEGLEDIDQSDLMLPRMRVIQPTSRLDGPRGTFHNNLTNETRATIHAVMLRVTKTRVCWDREKLDAPPICASDNAKTPRAEHAGKFSSKCAQCPMGQWRDDGTPPLCRLTYNFLCADLDDEDAPFIISLAGVSVKNARKIVSVFGLKRKKLFTRPVQISAVEVKNDKGRFYEVVLVTTGGGEAFDWRPYEDMYLGLKSMALTADTEPTLADAPAGEEEIPF